MASFLKYTGPAQVVEVAGYGHFGPGDEKQVDDITAGAFRDDRCKAEGWEVRDEQTAQTPASPSVEAAGGVAPAGGVVVPPQAQPTTAQPSAPAPGTNVQPTVATNTAKK